MPTVITANDITANSTNFSDTTTGNRALTITGGSNRSVYCIWSADSGTNHDPNATFDGVPMTRILHGHTTVRAMAIFRIDEADLPGAGSYNAVVTWTTGNAWVLSCFEVTDVDQTDPDDAVGVTGNGGENDNPQQVVSSAIGDLVIGAVQQNNPTGSEPANDSGTSIGLATNGQIALRTAYWDGAASVTADFTSGGFNGWTIAAFNVNAAAVGGVEGTATPGLGLTSAIGLIPGLLTLKDVLTGVGFVSLGGLAPALHTQRLIQPGIGLSTIGGHSPSALGLGQIGPTTGLCSTLGLVPTLYTERVIEPTTGLVTLDGLIPDVFREVELTITPDIGLVTLSGPEPAIVTEQVRGHAITKKRRRGTRIYSPPPEPESDKPAVSLPVELTPVPAAIFDPPATRIAGIDTSEAHARLSTIETARLARRRREEEELIAILMRAA